ncbi:MAG: hypothetical protein K2X47_19785 [Bdellovibrionales bacterium]|nr:hypothetical protein [Bdellovibrionales bacterium]
MFSEDHMEQLRTLIEQSEKGIHLLFERQVLSRVLSQPEQELSLEGLKSVQDVLGEFVQRKTLSEKRAFIQTLPDQTRELLIKAYFNLLDNKLQESIQLKH